jgi:hypothetical protein
VQSLADLQLQQVAFGVVENSDVQSFILYNKKAALRKMSAYWVLYPSLGDAVSALRNGDISAVMGRTQLLQYYAQMPPCVLSVVDLPIAIDFWSFVLPKVSWGASSSVSNWGRGFRRVLRSWLQITVYSTPLDIAWNNAVQSGVSAALESGVANTLLQVS